LVRHCDRCGEPVQLPGSDEWLSEVAEIVEKRSETLEEALAKPHLLVHVGCMRETDELA
jgi:hypothetical protein